jgi:hypothetical protein
MIVLVDTNVVFDVIEKRQPHYSASNQILCLCRRKALVGAVAFHTVANVFYQYGKAAAPFLRDRLLQDFSVHGARQRDNFGCSPLGSYRYRGRFAGCSSPDGGRKLHRYAQHKDFKFSRVPALAPPEFLSRFNPG